MRKLIFILLLFVCKISFAQITYHNSASTPADNGTNTATTTAVTPPASMTTGDLVVIYAYQRGATTTISISEASGQTWTSEATHGSSTAVLSGRVFWCKYNGTWGSNPSVVFSIGTNTNVVMHVFRPTSTSYHWALESVGANGNQLNSFTAQAAPVTPISSLTTTNSSTVSVAIWSTDDDNTWGTLTGSGWTSLGSTQYRNTSGSDVSSTYAYNIRTTAGSVSAASKTQATLGNDPGIRGAWVWYEYIPSALPRRINIISMAKEIFKEKYVKK